MEIYGALENHLVSLMVMLLIFVDYARKYNTDPFQRSIFLQILLFAMTALSSNLCLGYLSRQPEYEPGNIPRLLVIIYYAFQVLSFFYIIVFVDYTIYKEAARSRKFIAGSWFVTGIYIFLLVLLPGISYSLHIKLLYIPALVILIEIIASLKLIIKYQLQLLFIFWGAVSLGILADRFLGTRGLIWPFYAAALLYAYLRITRGDSKIDALTGIGNRYAFNEFIEKLSRKILKEKENPRLSYSVVMLDIDNFKSINDILGHAEGDNALRDMASIIRGCIRRSDFAARYGGDEFILVVPAEYDIQKVLERIRESLELQNSKNLRPYKLEMSYGWDIYTPGNHKSLDEFIHHVDFLMYKQKEEHRRLRSGVLH